jgi:hypothetical protein
VEEELNKVELGYIRKNKKEIQLGRTYKQTTQRFNGIEQQNIFPKVRERRSLISYCEMKLVWTRDEHTLLFKGREKLGSMV